MELEVKFQESQQAMAVKLFQEMTVLPLPKLTNPGAAEHLLEGVQMIDDEGNVVDGAMPDYLLMKITNQTLAEYRNETVTSLSTAALQGWSGLKSIYMPALETIGAYAFAGVGASVYDFPNVETVQAYAFDWSGETKIDFHKVTTIKAGVFNYNGNLVTLIIRSGSVCSLANANAFTGTPIAKGTGWIYAPSALVDSYKTATNWATYADQIRAIEDYPDITGG